ncbi:MAG: SprT family zinc-dependent metalloprotease [Alphaproteobacteria bacterium]|nr:SprT family zinc-dependent metalloprotease [Alphaproteobacteria bacterium]
MNRDSKPIPEQFELPISNGAVMVSVRRSLKAQRLQMRLNGRTRSLELILPVNCNWEIAKKFAEKNAGWAEEHLSRLASRPRLKTFPFEDGAIIPLLGKNLRLVADPKGRLTRLHTPKNDDEDLVLRVAGRPEFFASRVTAFLVDQARIELTRSSHAHAKRLGLRINTLRLGDAGTRWGSCSSSGNLNFSWRLIFAPLEVLDYVAAHEVAHLCEMNHSPQFWALVGTMVPDYELHRKWLKKHGQELMLMGIPSDSANQD